ncbi:hypothetical protein LINPERHAP2_LOCUS3174, partial [Linum perenne]
GGGNAAATRRRQRGGGDAAVTRRREWNRNRGKKNQKPQILRCKIQVTIHILNNILLVHTFVVGHPQRRRNQQD